MILLELLIEVLLELFLEAHGVMFVGLLAVMSVVVQER